MIRIALLSLLAAGAALAQKPCDTPDHRAFDFWLGEWNVYAKGKLAGENSITREYGGCLVHEHYKTPGGYTGESLNAYDAGRKVWIQTWVDSGGLVLRLEGGRQGESMVLEGSTLGKDGVETKHRITWTPQAEGAVRQHWESSKGGGEWTTAFDGRYKPK